MRAAAVLTTLCAGALLVAAEENKADSKRQSLFDGKSLEGWKLRHEATEKRPSKWRVASAVAADQSRFLIKKGTGVLVNGDDGRGIDLLSEFEHGDCDLHIEFNVPKGSNSGVYFQGQYEVQILDSYGKPDKDLNYHDCGGIYDPAKSPPRTNACKKPGEWQSYDVIFHAPRFDETGKKTANAKFIKVVHNGKVIQENVEVPGPTIASLGGAEKPKGPLMLQGDHGPVAFRNIRIKPLGAK